METDTLSKYNEIKKIIKKRFIIRIVAYALLLAFGIGFTAYLIQIHSSGHYLLQEQGDDLICLVLVGFGASGIFGSIQYYKKSMKLLDEKMKR